MKNREEQAAEDDAIPLLSLWEPWASLVAMGIKGTETRGKPAPKTILGRRIAIHAAQTKVGIRLAMRDPDLFGACMDHGILKRDFKTDHLPLGCVVATAFVEASIPVEKLTPDIYGNYSTGRYGWILSDIRRLETPFPCKGAQWIGRVTLPRPVPDLLAGAGPGDARCNFCDGPMPCFCPEPAGHAEAMEEDAILRSRYDDR